MCPGFEEWWLYKCFKSPKLVIFNFYAQIMPREFLVDTTLCTYVAMCYIKQLAIKTKHFHWCWYFSTDQWWANLSQWWLFYLNGSQPLWARPWCMIK